MQRSFSILLIFMVFTGCQVERKESAAVNHVVLCWLKDKSPASKEKFLKAVKSLSSIPSVVSVSTGELTPSSEPVADNSFDIGFIIKFHNKAGLDSYLVHPEHVSAVNKVLKPSLKKVIVYDFESN